MDEKQLQLLYNEYAKGQGFKDYNEFKSLMDNNASRQAFFDDTNKDLGFKDYNEFNHILGYDSQEVKQQQQPQANPQTGIPMADPNNIQNLISEQNKKFSTTPNEFDFRQKEIRDKDAAINNHVDKIVKQYQITDPKDIENLKESTRQELDNGKLALTENNQGEPVIKQSGGFFKSFTDAINHASQTQSENDFLFNADKNTAIEYLNRTKDSPQTGIVKETETAPSGFGGALGNLLGENAEALAKGVTGAVAGAATELTGGASFGTFLSTAKDFAHSGYSQSLKQNYYTLKQQNPNMSDEEAFENAQKASLGSEAASLGTGAVLSKAAPTNEATQGFLNTVKHTVETAPKVLGATAAGSAASDVLGAAVGEHKDVNEILSNASEAVKSMAVMHFGLGILPQVIKGAADLPKELKPQIENVVASMPREEVVNHFQEQEQQGTVPQGTTEQVINHLNNFDEAKKTVDDLPLTEEQKATVASRINEQKAKPSDSQKIQDIKNGNLVTFTYNKESDIPEIFKDKVSSSGETNGEKIYRVTLPKSEADYYLSQNNPNEQKNTTTTEPVAAPTEAQPKEEEESIIQQQGVEGNKAGNEEAKIRSDNSDFVRDMVDEHTVKESPLTFDEKDRIHSAINDYEDGKISGEELRDAMIKNGMNDEFIVNKVSEKLNAQPIQSTEQENVGEVVQEPKENKVVAYHGTNKEFTDFEPQGLGVHFGTKGQASERGNRIIQADLIIKNPFRMDDMGSDYDMKRLADELFDAGLISKEKVNELQSKGSPEDIKNILKENGYDGIVYKNRVEDKKNPSDSYIVFDKSQIKQQSSSVDLSKVANEYIEYNNGDKNKAIKHIDALIAQFDSDIKTLEGHKGEGGDIKSRLLSKQDSIEKLNKVKSEIIESQQPTETKPIEIAQEPAETQSTVVSSDKDNTRKGINDNVSGENIPEQVQKPTETKEDNSIVANENNLTLQSDESKSKNISAQENKSNENSSRPLDEKTVKEKLNQIEDVTDPYDKILHYFANDGKINSSAIQELFGGKDKRIRQSASTESEKRSRISLLSKNAPSIDALAHQMWEGDQTGKYTTMDYKDAIEKALQDFNSKGAMAKNLIERYDVDAAYQKFIEQNYPKELIDKADKVTDEMSDEELNHLLQLASYETHQKELEDYIDNLQTKNNNNNAIQEQSAGSVLQHPQEGVREKGRERERVESIKQRQEPSATLEQQPPTQPAKEKVTQGGEPPKEPPFSTTTATDRAGNNLVGVSHAALTDLANRLGLKEPERGDYIPPEWFAERGRKLLDAGADPNEVNNPNNELHDRISIARAHLEDLYKQADVIGKEKGLGSQEYKNALDEVRKYSNDIVKKLGTKAHQAFVALQGRRDIDTGSFTSVRRAVEETTGKPINKAQEQKIQELTTENQTLKQQAEELEKKLIEATDKAMNEGGDKSKKTYTEKAKNVADKFRKLKSKPLTFKDENGNEITPEIQGITWNDLVELGAKAIEKTGEIADGVAAIIEKVKDAEWYVKLSTNDKQKFEEQLNEHYSNVIQDSPEAKKIKRLEKERDDLLNGNAKQKSGKPNYKFTEEQKQKVQDLEDEIEDLKQQLGLVKSKQEKPVTEEEQKESDAKELKNIQGKFVNKSNKDLKFTTDEAKELWEYAKKNYINKGVDYIETIKSVSDDTGLTIKQVAAAFETPKTKRMSDARWAKQSELLRSKARVNDYVEMQTASPIWKVVKKVSAVPRAIVTAGHGHIYIGTHYPMGLVTPQDWNKVFIGIGKMAKSAYGKEAYYAKEVASLTNDKNYILAKRAGLQNDVENTSTDDFEKSGKIFGKIGRTGTKGFLGLKWTRQMMFNNYWDALPKEQQTQAVAEEIAKLVNLATGASNYNIPNVVKEGFFSAQMESARWGRLFRNPARAGQAVTRITTALAKGEEIRPEDKVFLKIWGSRVGQQIVTLVSVLGANAFIQSKLHPSNPVNLKDPSQSDWLKLKAGDITIDLSGGTLGIKSFLTTIGQYAVNDKSYKKMTGDIGGKAIGYFRGKLSPLYGDITENAIFGTDFAGNPLPYRSDLKPSAGKHILTWKEYISSKAPIPLADALENVYSETDANGVPRSTTDKIVDGVISSVVSAGVGVHTTPSYNPPPTPFTDADKKDPVFKYFIDKGMELPNVADHNVLIKDKATRSDIPLTKFPDKVAKYDAAHKVFLKQELAKVKNKGYVYTDGYKDKDGNMNISLTYSNGEKRVPVSKLNKKELAKILHLTQTQATKKTKLKIFGTD